MYDAMAFSILVLFLSGSIIICVVGTVTPLFMNQSNVGDIMPMAMKGAKISIWLAGICGVLVLISPDSAIRDISVVITTAVLFVWSWVLIVLLKMRYRKLVS